MHFPPRTLAIDFGTRRIGLAISEGSLAEPLSIVPHEPQRTDLALARIKEIADEEGIQQVLIGISEAEMAQKSRAFATQLKEHLQVPIIFFDETLSSQEAEQLLQAGGRHSMDKKLDHYAAAHFLQEWIDDFQARSRSS